MVLFSKKVLRLFILFAVLLFAAYVVAQSLDVLSLNEVAMSTHSQELEGIQGASITATEVQVVKAVERGKKEEAVTLDSLMKQQMECFRIINAALAAQQDYYSAQLAKDAGRTTETLAVLEEAIPKARSAFDTLGDVTRRKIALIRSTTGDEGAVNVENATLNSWAAAVRSLSTEPRTEREVEEKNEAIAENASVAIRTAHLMARHVDPGALTQEQKTNLDVNVVTKGEAVIRNLGDVLKVLPNLLLSMAQGTSVGMGMIDDAMRAYRGKSWEQMLHDASYGQGFFSKQNMSSYQRAMDSVGMQIQGFLGYYSPFIQTVGEKVGRTVSVSAAGVDMIFVDPRGRYLLVEGRSDKYEQVLLDGFATRTRPNGDIQVMLIFEFTPEYKQVFLRENPELASQLRNVAFEFRFLRLSAFDGHRRYAILERNFQDSEHRQIYHAKYRGTDYNEIMRRTLMQKVRELALVVAKDKK